MYSLVKARDQEGLTTLFGSTIYVGQGTGSLPLCYK